MGLVTSGLPAQTKKPAARDSRTTKAKPQTPPEPKLPTVISLSNGESIPMAELVPRSEAVINQLGQMAAQLRSPDVKQVETSVATLAQTVNAAADDAKKSVRMARSALQLPEMKMTWVRYRGQLEALNTVVVRYGTGLDDAQKQVSSEREKWSAIVSAMEKAKVPDEYVQRASTVVGMADQVQSTLREETENLIKMQVQVSETRTQIDDILDQINVADAALREQVFVIDSPPIWSVLGQVSFSSTWHQVRTIISGVQTRTSNFYQSYRSKLLFYFLLNAGVFVLLLHFSRTDPSTWNLPLVKQEVIFRRPIVLSAFVMLVFFGVFFAKAPPEVVRFSRMLLVIPVVLLAIEIFEKHVQRYVVALGAIYVINVMSLQLLAGTVSRRLLDLALCGIMLGGMWALLRKGGTIRTLLEERGFHLVLNGLYVAGFLLVVSVFTNIVGNVSLSDVLTNGTIFSVYYVMGAYVYYFTLYALVCAVTGSSLGRRSRAIRMHRDLVDRKIAKWLKVTAWMIWGLAVLLSFQVSNQAFDETREILRKKWEVGAISISLLDVVLFGLVFYVSMMIARFIRFLLDEEVLPRTEMNPGAAQAGSRLTYIALLTVGFFLSLGAAGLELSKITVLTGAFGVGLGFGLQNVVNNFVCGIIVSLERPVQVGDSIEVGTLLGEVRSIGFRSCTLRTFDGADVIVPNSELITKPVVNWSLTDLFRRTDIVIGAAYGTDPKLVIQILQELTTKHPGVMKYPEPLITFDQFADSSLNFTVRFWSKLDGRLQVRSELNIQIAEEFAKHGIAIPFPQRDVHVHMPSGEELSASLKASSVKASS